jgi:hypothetical protein
VQSREIGLADAVVLLPVIGVIVLFAFYPQLALRRSEPAVKASVAAAQAASSAPVAAAETGSAWVKVYHHGQSIAVLR